MILNKVIWTIILIFFSIQYSISKNLKIALIGVHDERYEHIGKYAHINKRAYAEKHGYDYFLYNYRLDTGRAAYWDKVVALQRHLSDYDWLFWLDSDALIMNDSIKLESIIDEDYDFITTRDCLRGMNSGQFLIKNTQWSRDFLKLWYSPKYEHTQVAPGFDNGALIQIYQEHPKVKEHIKIVPQRLLSSYLQCPGWFNIDGEYQPGDFVIHFAAVNHDLKEKYMKEYFEKSME